MIKSKVVFRISQPLEQVYDYVTNPDNFSLWMPGLRAVSDVSHSRLIHGSTFKLQYAEGRKTEDMSARVMLCVPLQKLAILATGQKAWFRRVFEFHQKGQETEIVYTEERTDVGSGLSFMFFMMNNTYQNLSQEGCENLKKLMENRVPALAAASATSIS